jgi:cytochrome c-type biogenesis protein CcmH
VVTKLQERLAKQPDDVEGWKMLGRSATVLGDYSLAREAFGEAYTHTRGQDAEAVVGYAESLVLNDEREIDGHAADLFERALELAPENPRALWYGGIVAYRRGDLALAEQRWVELQNREEITPDLRQFLAERLAEIGAARDGLAGTTGEPARGAIEVSIDIKPELAARARQNSSLFVIARRGEGGPPIAVVRRTTADWPITVTMSDANAMLPGTSLASGGPLTLIARISQSGAPTASSGDLFGEVGYDFSSALPARITIDRIVP